MARSWSFQLSLLTRSSFVAVGEHLGARPLQPLPHGPLLVLPALVAHKELLLLVARAATSPGVMRLPCCSSTTGVRRGAELTREAESARYRQAKCRCPWWLASLNTPGRPASSSQGSPISVGCSAGSSSVASMAKALASDEPGDTFSPSTA